MFRQVHGTELGGSGVYKIDRLWCGYMWQFFSVEIDGKVYL